MIKKLLKELDENFSSNLVFNIRRSPGVVPDVYVATNPGLGLPRRSADLKAILSSFDEMLNDCGIWFPQSFLVFPRMGSSTTT